MDENKMIMDDIMVLVHAWQAAMVSKEDIEMNVPFRQALEKINNNSKIIEDIRPFIKGFFHSRIDIKSSDQIVATELMFEINSFQNEQRKISKKAVLNDKEREDFKKNAFFHLNEQRATFKEIQEQRASKRDINEIITADFHPTILDSTTLLNKRNILITASIIMILAFTPDLDLKSFEIFKIKIGEKSPSSLWGALLVGLIYLSTYYFGRIYHYHSVYKDNKMRITEHENKTAEIKRLKDKFDIHSRNLQTLYENTKYSDEGKFMTGEKVEEESIDDLVIQNPFTMTNTKAKLFWGFDIIFPFTVSIIALIAATVQIYNHNMEHRVDEVAICNTPHCPAGNDALHRK